MDKKNSYKKGIIFGIIFLLINITFNPIESVVSKSIIEEDFLPTVIGGNDNEKTVTFYVFDKKGNSEQEIIMTSEEFDNFYNMFKDLNNKITYQPFSSKTNVLKSDFVALLDSLDFIPEGSSKEDITRLMSPIIGNNHRPLLSLIMNPVRSGRGYAFFCNYATFGEGSQFPVIIFPRLIPIIQLPIPRVFMRWNAIYGVTSCGGLLSGKGFIAEGAQQGFALGFWGIGFSVFLPPVMSFGFIGYALYSTATAENIIPWPPNRPPDILSENPPDGTIDVPVDLPELSFSLNDLDGDIMNYTVTTDPYIGGDSGNNVNDGEFSFDIFGLESDTEYSWTVHVSDGHDTSEETFTFHTAIEAPLLSDPSPVDGDSWIPVDLSEISIRLDDLQGDLMDYTIETSPDIGSGSGSGVGNGIYSISVSGLEYTRDYTWFVNVTDGNFWVRKPYYFKTQPIMEFNPFEKGWSYRKKITIDHSKVAGEISNFPVLISIVDSDLASKAQSGGGDILFMDGDGTADRLLHEIELFDDSDGELVSWVNVTSVSDSEDTIFYIYYGNQGCSNQEYSEQVWDSNYKSVWHLTEKGTGLRFDSSLNGIDATPNSYDGDEGIDNGKINGADDFDGDNDRLITGYSFDYDYRTVSFWINTDKKPSSDPNIIISQNANTLKYGTLYANVRSDGIHAKAGGEGKGEEFIFDININTWYLVQLVRDHDLTKYYVNGNLIKTGNSGDIGSSSHPNPYLILGSSRVNDRFFDGIIDEVRVSNIARSSDWISTEYNNQNDISSFLSFGIEESIP
jgi:hypothetical protein